MAISKVVYGGDTLIDLTSDSVNAENLMRGATAHGADGELVFGQAEASNPITITNLDTGEVTPLTNIIISSQDIPGGFDNLPKGTLYLVMG